MHQQVQCAQGTVLRAQGSDTGYPSVIFCSAVRWQGAGKRQGGGPEGSGGVDNVQGAVAEAGLPVSAPLWLLFVAVACRVACSCAVPISLHHHTGSLSQTCPNSLHAQNDLSPALMLIDVNYSGEQRHYKGVVHTAAGIAKGCVQQCCNIQCPSLVWHVYLEGECAFEVGPGVTDCVVDRVNVGRPDRGVGRSGAASVQVLILCRHQNLGSKLCRQQSLGNHHQSQKVFFFSDLLRTSGWSYSGTTRLKRCCRVSHKLTWAGYYTSA